MATMTPQQAAEIQALLAKGNALGTAASKQTGVAFTPIAPSTSLNYEVTPQSIQYSRELAQRAQSLGVPNVPTSLLAPQPAQAPVSPVAAALSQAGAAPSAPTPSAPTTPTVPTTTQPSQNQNMPQIPTSTGPAYTPTAIPSLKDLMGGDSGNTNATDNQLLEKILGFMTPSDEEKATTQEISDLDASTRKSYRDIEGQPIAVPFITGQSAAVERVAQDRLANLQNRAATLQAQRQTALDASKFALEYSDNRSDENYARKLQAAQLELQRLGMSADEAYRKATLDLQKYEIDQPSSSSGGLTEVSPGATLYDPNTGQPVYTAPNRPTASAGYTEVSPGATLFDPATGKVVYTAPTAKQTSSAGSTGTSTPGNVSLDQGAQGESVRALQSFLMSQGMSIFPDQLGIYGPATKNAVAKFQKAAGVDTSGGGVGTFGPRTQAAAKTRGFTLSPAPSSTTSSKGRTI